jgi:hypothetical protein
MRRIAIGSASLALVAVACAHSGGEAGTATLTSARLDPGLDPAPLEIRPDMRLATAVCDRESSCNLVGQGAIHDSMRDCIGRVSGRARAQLDAWTCSPAASRARYEECLASIAEEPCTTIVDRAERVQVCQPTTECGL